MEIDIELVPTTISLRKPKLRVIHVYWPVFTMRSWVEALSQAFPKFMFGGFELEDEQSWRSLFSWFWQVYQQIDGSHPVYSELGDVDRSLVIPIMLHGDEGRGLRSTPFMVESWQFVLSYLGPYTTNTSG